LWYDDFHGGSPVTQDLLDVLTYRTGVNANDAAFKSSFPYVASPWAGTHVCDCNTNQATTAKVSVEQIQSKSFSGLGLSSPEIFMRSMPNPVKGKTSIDYNVDAASQIKIIAYDMQGKMIKVLVDRKHDAGTYNTDFDLSDLAQGTYLVAAIKNGMVKQTIKIVKN